MTDNNSLIFSMTLKQSNQLITGRLAHLVGSEVKHIFIATSGLPRYQTRHNLSTKSRGAIPPSHLVDFKASKHYSVHTRPIMLASAGIEGNFYKIEPMFVKIGSQMRGDFGIHFDANVPGSAGCIVIINQDPWQVFQEEMSALSRQGVSQIPLIVLYT